MAKKIVAVLSFLAFAASLSWCETANIEDLITQYGEATEVQRPVIESSYKYKTMAVGGIVEDVRDWNTFDERTDTAGLYYQVIMEARSTATGIPYQVRVLYKDKTKVAALAKGREIDARGVFIKIADERDRFVVSIYAGELGAEDKVMLGV